MSQHELASLMRVHDSQVSREERNEHHGIAVARATKIFEALGITLQSKVTQVDTDTK